MKNRIIKAMLATALTSLAGYAFRAWRERKAHTRRASDEAAIQAWDTDGSGNPHDRYKRSPSTAHSGL